MSKAELVLSMGSNYQSTAQIEKELKKFWNNLTDQQENDHRPPSHNQPNSNETQKNPNDKDNWLVKYLVILLVITLLLGVVIIICRFAKRKRK